MAAASRSLATAPGKARFASGLLPKCYTTNWDTTQAGLTAVLGAKQTRGAGVK